MPDGIHKLCVLCSILVFIITGDENVLARQPAVTDTYFCKTVTYSGTEMADNDVIGFASEFIKGMSCFHSDFQKNAGLNGCECNS